MAKLGTEKRPVRFQVQTEGRLQEVASLCDKNGWIFVGGFELMSLRTYVRLSNC
jgi:hypothetical protein